MKKYELTEEYIEVPGKKIVPYQGISVLLAGADCSGYEMLEGLKELRKLEQQGLLLKLPCKVGDTVYILAGRFGTFYEKDICDGFYIGSAGILQIKVQNNKGNHGTYGILGETVFLTQTEAEEALKKIN